MYFLQYGSWNSSETHECDAGSSVTWVLVPARRQHSVRRCKRARPRRDCNNVGARRILAAQMSQWEQFRWCSPVATNVNRALVPLEAWSYNENWYWTAPQLCDGLCSLPCFTHAEWIPKCTKLCMNAMRKLQCVEVTVLQEFAQWTVDDVQVAGLLWAAQTRFDIRHHAPLASLEAWGFPSSHFVSSRGWSHMISQVVATTCHWRTLRNHAAATWSWSHRVHQIVHQIVLQCVLLFAVDRLPNRAPSGLNYVESPCSCYCFILENDKSAVKAKTGGFVLFSSSELRPGLAGAKPASKI